MRWWVVYAVGFLALSVFAFGRYLEKVEAYTYEGVEVRCFVPVAWGSVKGFRPLWGPLNPPREYILNHGPMRAPLLIMEAPDGTIRFVHADTCEVISVLGRR
jgi:hypothetical protein